MKTRRTGTLLSLLLVLAAFASAARGADSFRFAGKEFVLNDKRFQFIAGELHFQRIPREYWRDRLLKARAMGLNSVCTYVFWNALEPEPGRFDFGGRNDLAAFLRTAQEVGLWVVVRPGPYACAEWDFGGLPAWLLRTPDIKIRCLDERYIQACDRYIRRLAEEIRPLLVGRGGPVLMLQLENEYGSYGNDRGYLLWLKDAWTKAGIDVPFCTADGATPYMLEAGSVPGAAIGLDPGTNEKHYAEAAKLGRDVPVFCSEFYPGWLTHWGEAWARVKTEEILPELKWLLDNKKSFSFYVFHGGTNFGFWAGANFGDAYQPDVTSYDYDAPLDEAGRPTPKYFALRDLIKKYLPPGARLPEPPKPLPAIEFAEVRFTQEASLFDNLTAAVRSPQPRPMEFYGQNHGFILYRTKLVGHRGGKLTLTDLHDYANVYVDGDYLGTLDRRTKGTTVEIPRSSPPPAALDILVEGMGRINYGQHMIDRKGITDRVTLNAMTLMDWEVVCLPFDAAYLARLRFGPPDAGAPPGKFFRATFEVASPGDTYLDMSGWKKGVVWVNGENLGRYWEIGPQKRLFCPAPFLKKGTNEIIVFDLHLAAPAVVKGVTSLDDSTAQRPAAGEWRIWPSRVPADCPVPVSKDINGIAFTGRHREYENADTWYPSWAADDVLYSPFTDGKVGEISVSSANGAEAATGQAKILGSDPLDLRIVPLGVHKSSALPYGGRYPCGSLVVKGVWYYGTYCLDQTFLNWDILGPFVGFRISRDFGRTWTETPHTSEKPLFGESGKNGGKIKVGAPHFVDFGKEMEHSPDGRAYLVGHGAADPQAKLSWISGDEVYLLRVKPLPETMNDPAAYEFYGGTEANGAPVWTRDFGAIKPLFKWPGHVGVVTMTYDAPLRKYLLCITDGWPTVGPMSTYILEADAVTGPWRMAVFMKYFGEQAYFVNIPTKFISRDGGSAWLCYSTNFTNGWIGTHYESDPPGGRYALSLQEFVLLKDGRPVR